MKYRWTSIMWLALLSLPLCSMNVYEELPDLNGHQVTINGIHIGFHTMNDVDPNFTYVIATVSADYKIQFERVHITWQPHSQSEVVKIEPEGVHTTDDTIVVNFKMPRR